MPTRRDSDPRLRHLVKSIMYLSTDECFQLLGEMSANVLLTIMTNEPFVVSDDYMSLDGIMGASIPLNDLGFLRPSIRFSREGQSHKAHLLSHECRESCLKTNRICMAVGMAR